MFKIRKISYAIIIALLIFALSSLPAAAAVDDSTISAKGEYIWIGGRNLSDTSIDYKASYTYADVTTDFDELETYIREPVSYQTFYEVASNDSSQRLGLGVNVPKNKLGYLTLPIVFPQFSSHYEQSYVRWKFYVASNANGGSYNIKGGKLRFTVFNDDKLEWYEYIVADVLTWYKDTEKNRIVAEIESPIMYNWSGYAELDLFFTSSETLDLSMIQIYTFKPEVYQGSAEEIHAQRQEEDFNKKGEDSSDELANAIPNESAGFMSAIQTFVNSMSTTETQCNLTLPEAYIPKIKNVCNKTKLWDETPINFDQVFNMLPKSVLSIVRALSTVGLTIYCFKELYGTISYVLTMKKGESDNE